MVNKLIKISFICLLLSLILPIVSFAQPENQIFVSEEISKQREIDLSFSEELLIPGRIEGNGTYFEIKDSEYLNIALESNQEIKLVLESIPEMVMLYIEPISGATSSEIILSGFSASTTYYKYEDDYYNEVVFTTDEKGNYVYTQDLSQPHFVFIQPRAGTKFIKDDAAGGDCSSIGTWNPLTKTCILTTDLSETVQIDNDNIILDCNGHSITGTDSGYGIYLSRKKNIDIKNCTVTRFSLGLGPLMYSSNNNITGNDVSMNHYGVLLYYYSINNNIAENNISSSNSGIELRDSSNNNVIIGNNISSNWGDFGINLVRSSNNNITRNSVSRNRYGILLYYSPDNNITENSVLENGFDGIHLYYSSGNIVTANSISSSWQNGILLYYSLSNNIVGNDVLNNSSGIDLWFSSHNNITENNVSNNRFYGIRLFFSSDNNFMYHNNLISNNIQAWVSERSFNNLFDNGYPSGGNYWSDYTGVDEKSGPNQDQPSSDGIGDIPYTFYGGQDRYPFMKEDGWKIPERILPDKAKDLAKEVIDAPYLGDGKTWGGKGFECKTRKFIDPEEIKTKGYYYYDGRIRNCSAEKGKGVDCSGLSFWSYNRAYFNDKLLTTEEYESRPLYYEGAARQYKDNTKIIEKEELKPGDLLFFDTNENGFMDHVAMYIGEGNAYNTIHASGFTETIIFANYDLTTEELITVKPTDEIQHLKVNAYGRVTEPKIEFQVTATSSINLIVTDPEGFIATIENPWDGPMEYQVYDINGDGELDDIVLTGKRKIGDYLITVIPEPDALPTDTYTLEVEALINGETATIVLAKDVPISEIPRAPYILRSIETEIILIIPTFVDFDPGTLNLKSNGQDVTVYIELPLGYDVNKIDLESITLNNQIPTESRLTEINDYNGNGILDLMVKFNRLAVQNILEEGNEVKITISGNLIDGRPFEGRDTIRVINKNK